MIVKTVTQRPSVRMTRRPSGPYATLVIRKRFGLHPTKGWRSLGRAERTEATVSALPSSWRNGVVVTYGR